LQVLKFRKSPERDVESALQFRGFLSVSHLRHWRFRRNEGKVECQALANFRDAAQRLGATAAQVEDLYPYALAEIRSA
jgi:hypothetical protein